MKRCFLICICSILLSSPIFAQTIYSGFGSNFAGNIFEDGIMDDGTRYIISDMQQVNTYAFSLCKFIPSDGEPWYGISVETKEYMPKNGYMVFICEKDGFERTIVLGQKGANTTDITKGTLGLTPFLFFGSKGSDLSFLLHKKIVQEKVCYAIFPLSSSELDILLSTTIKRIRISTRSTYYQLYISSYFDRWLVKSKECVDIRSNQSINRILEGLD